VELKKKYDPTNFFRMNQNIKPAWRKVMRLTTACSGRRCAPPLMLSV